MEFTEALRRRRMVRNFTGASVPREVVGRIVRAALTAPSAGFAQGQCFVIVTDEERRRDISRLAREEHYARRGFDRWLSTAPVHIVLCVDDAAYRERYSAPDKRASGGRGDWDVPYQWVDAGAALMLLLIATVDEGLAAGFFGAHRLPGLRDLLDLPAEVTPIGIVTVGHPARDRRSRSLDAGRRPVDQVVHWEEWGGRA